MAPYPRPGFRSAALAGGCVVAMGAAFVLVIPAGATPPGPRPIATGMRSGAAGEPAARSERVLYRRGVARSQAQPSAPHPARPAAQPATRPSAHPATRPSAHPAAGTRLAQVTVVRRDGSVSVVDAADATDAAALARNLRRTDPDVVGAGVSHVVAVADADPYESQQTHLPAVHASAGWAAGQLGTGVKVAVLDTGITDHPDLDSQVVERTDLALDGSTSWHYHGTHVAGIVAAARNGVGVVGVAPQASLLDVRVLDADGYGTSADVAAGIVWAVDHGAKIINMSLGAPEWDACGNSGTDAGEAAAVAYAVAHGVLVVAAAGNDGQGANRPEYPAAYPGVVGVGAVGDDGAHASFSQTGYWVDLSAPGVHVLSDVPGGLGWANGTSMATPVVAGLAAGQWQVHPGWTAAQVEASLTDGALDLGSPGRDDVFGAGLVRAEPGDPDATVVRATATPAPSPTTWAEYCGQPTGTTPTTSSTAPSSTPSPTPSPTPTAPPVTADLVLQGPSSARYGTRVTLDALIQASLDSPPAGVKLTWQARRVGTAAWTTIARTTSGSLGQGRLTPVVTGPTQYRVVSAATSRQTSASSNGVTVRPYVVATVLQTRGRTRVVLHGSTAPAGGMPIRVEKRVGSRWVVVGRVRADAAGRWSLTLRRGGHSRRVRVLFLGVGNWRAWTSPAVAAPLS